MLEDSLKVRGGWTSCRPTLAEHTTPIMCLVFHGQRSSSQEPQEYFCGPARLFSATHGAYFTDSQSRHSTDFSNSSLKPLPACPWRCHISSYIASKRHFSANDFCSWPVNGTLGQETLQQAVGLALGAVRGRPEASD